MNRVGVACGWLPKNRRVDLADDLDPMTGARRREPAPGPEVLTRWHCTGYGHPPHDVAHHTVPAYWAPTRVQLCKACCLDWVDQHPDPRAWPPTDHLGRWADIPPQENHDEP